MSTMYIHSRSPAAYFECLSLFPKSLSIKVPTIKAARYMDYAFQLGFRFVLLR